MAGFSGLIASLLLVVSLGGFGSAARILMNAFLGEGSHFVCAAAMAERLVEKGHNITFFISNAYAHRATDAKFANLFDFEIFHHSIPVEEVHKQLNAYNERAFEPASVQMLTFAELMRDARAADCDDILGDKALMDRLAMANYSFVVYDITWVCPVLMARKLGIPYATVSAIATPCTVAEGAGAVPSPAFVPGMFSALPNTMDFMDRVANTLNYIFIRLIGEYFRQPYNRLNEKYNISPGESIGYLVDQSDLFLVNSDFSVEFPCSLPPNVISVGGLTTKPAVALSDELEDFMQSSGEHGVIVCTMGTYFTSMPLNIVKAFIDAFARLPQKVIFQLRSIPSGITLPPNVMTLPWLPQNDLLGHEKTRGFLYSGGNNGFYEALYHAVPIVAIPIHADQPDVGAKVASQGIGITIDKGLLSETRIFEALKDVTTNSTYARSVVRLSAMYRDRPMTPAERAAFWIDHVISHGGKQYQVPVVHMDFIKSNLIDVLCFLVGCLMLGLFITFFAFRLFFKLLCIAWRVMNCKEKQE
ncbi:UDP-glucuronosyltransferase 2B33-like [Diadema antillarum]|uniref:UDP-glucuronosyltransferase 2B33-like n=1 Tax=Diadema antillarum TaxID=105358 RepID=UPI003A88B93C